MLIMLVPCPSNHPTELSFFPRESPICSSCAPRNSGLGEVWQVFTNNHFKQSPSPFLRVLSFQHLPDSPARMDREPCSQAWSGPREAHPTPTLPRDLQVLLQSIRRHLERRMGGNFAEKQTPGRLFRKCSPFAPSLLMKDLMSS